MAVQFEDYYQTLGVKRDASADEIKRAYRQLARKLHPDTNKDDPDAAAKFSKVGEAYEVLSDPEKRQKYDQFGQHWKHGQSINPDDLNGVFGGGFGRGGTRHGFRGFGGDAKGPHGFHFESSGSEGFSDFFEALFGQMREAHAQDAGHGFDPRAGQTSAPRMQETAHDLTVTLHEALHGGTRSLSLQTPDGTSHLDVKIPAGVRDGSKIRLKEHGVVLRIAVAPHPDFTVAGSSLLTDVCVDPATAALGGKSDVNTPDGKATLTIPPGTNSGAKLRLKAQGLPTKPNGTDRGDLIARVMITVPKELTDRQHAAYEALREADNPDASQTE